MRAITIEQYGDPSGLTLNDRPDPKPEAGQVAIRTDAIGVGGVDAVIRRGALGSSYPLGMIPGSEVVGVVTEVGDGVDPVVLGRRVWAFTGTDGAYAEVAIARAEDTVPLPDGLSSVEAATLGSAGPVAHFALRHAHASVGERVLVRGAAGSIGIAAVQLAARLEAAVVAVTTSSADRGQRLLELGATHVLDRAGHGEAGASEQYDVIIDVVGGADVPLFVDRLAPNGRMVLVGAVAGFPPADFGLSLMRSFQQSRSFATFSLATVPQDALAEVRAAQFAMAARGGLHAVVDSVLALEQAHEAHRRMDDGAVFGRIVLRP